MVDRERLENVNPTVHGRLDERKTTVEDEDDDIEDLFDTREIFDILKFDTSTQYSKLRYLCCSAVTAGLTARCFHRL